LGNFIKHVVGVSTNKGLKNPPKIYPNPLQKHNQPTQKPKMAQPVDGYVPLETKKMDKKNEFGEVGFG
jgi:hypothetical protein